MLPMVMSRHVVTNQNGNGRDGRRLTCFVTRSCYRKCGCCFRACCGDRCGNDGIQDGYLSVDAQWDEDEASILNQDSNPLLPYLGSMVNNGAGAGAGAYYERGQYRPTCMTRHWCAYFLWLPLYIAIIGMLSGVISWMLTHMRLVHWTSANNPERRSHKLIVLCLVVGGTLLLMVSLVVGVLWIARGWRRTRQRFANYRRRLGLALHFRTGGDDGSAADFMASTVNDTGEGSGFWGCTCGPYLEGDASIVDDVEASVIMRRDDTPVLLDDEFWRRQEGPTPPSSLDTNRLVASAVATASSTNKAVSNKKKSLPAASLDRRVSFEALLPTSGYYDYASGEWEGHDLIADQLVEEEETIDLVGEEAQPNESIDHAAPLIHSLGSTYRVHSEDENHMVMDIHVQPN